MIHRRWLGLSAIALLAVAGAPAAIGQAPAQAPAPAPAAGPADDAANFGARESVQQISLSPSGAKVAFIAAGPGQSTILYTADTAGGSDPKRVLVADGDPEELSWCRWASETRLVCTVAIITKAAGQVVNATRVVSLDATGGNAKLLSRDHRADDAYIAYSGGDVIDWLPDENGSVLMGRDYIPEQKMGTHLADGREGFGVDRIDVTSLTSKPVEPPRRGAIEYISDGRGKVRIMGLRQMNGATGYERSTISYQYRTADSRDWKPLGVFDTLTHEGFNPYAVDPELNVAYGFKKSGGREAFYSVALDGSLQEKQVFAHPQVDVDGLVRIGRRDRVVGVTYATEKREAVYFDPALQSLGRALSKALPGLPLIRFVDSSTDETKLLLWAGSDADPGRYYLFDKTAKKLNELMLSRPELENTKLATVKSITYTAADGTQIPAYLTLPPGSTGKNLPALVMPHGGPSSRDEWGFDWLPQYFAARGYAVIQPNYRGSSGFGDAWFKENGFRSWRTAMNDVADAGRWLTSQGIADPSKLAIFGWSYGGYAALQANVVDANLFKAAVAVAPVTDLAELVQESTEFANHAIVREMVGTGPHVREGSPAQNADKITAPVLLFHGELDSNVGIHESRMMDDRLRAANRSSELIVYPKLDHYLDSAEARADMLRRSDAFLRRTLHIK
jgi:dipeptidyl aminopeptidase/acylaminoacyl peptidase